MADSLSRRLSGRRRAEHRVVHAHQRAPPTRRRRCRSHQDACPRRPAPLGRCNRLRAAFQVPCFPCRTTQGPAWARAHNNAHPRATVRARLVPLLLPTCLPASTSTARTARRWHWEGSRLASSGATRHWAPQQPAHSNAQVVHPRSVECRPCRRVMERCRLPSPRADCTCVRCHRQRGRHLVHRSCPQWVHGQTHSSRGGLNLPVTW